MVTRTGLGSMVLLAWLASSSWARQAGPGGSGHHHHHHQGGQGGGFGYGPVVGYSYFGFRYTPYVITPPPIFITTGPLLPPWPGPVELPPGPSSLEGSGNPSPQRKGSPSRAEKLVELGDHLFRSHNLSRANERYQQALKADPHSATAHARLAQVAVVRGRYGEAADAFRAAEAVHPGWLETAKDIQALYAEPEDFGREVAKLESYLQTHPGDRDAWFVLGANWFLSGRSRKAADVFLRLSDRRVDASLAAFLAASLPEPLPADR